MNFLELFDALNRPAVHSEQLSERPNAARAAAYDLVMDDLRTVIVDRKGQRISNSAANQALKLLARLT